MNGIPGIQVPGEDSPLEVPVGGACPPRPHAGTTANAAGQRARGFLRRLGRAFRCAGIFLGGLPLFLRLRLSGKSNWRALWAQGISRNFLKLIDCTVNVSGAIPKAGMIVSNHLSYLDILAISSVSEGVFISKNEVRAWPVFGALAKMAGTIFVDRGRKTAVAGPLTSVAGALEAGLTVVLFPEGTSSDGSSVRPFQSSLLQAAMISRVPVTPAAISYEMEAGSVPEEICYWKDMAFAPHFWNLLGQQSITATLRFGTPRVPGGHRKDLARDLRQAVVDLRGGNHPVGSAEPSPLIA